MGRANAYTGDYEIHSLQYVGFVSNLRLVDLGKYVWRVRVGGTVGNLAHLASPPGVARGGAKPYADVKIDCNAANGRPTSNDTVRPIATAAIFCR